MPRNARATARYQAKAESRGEALEAAILVGTSPALFLTACASVPYEANELQVAAQLTGRPEPMRRAKTIDLMVPVDAEIVIASRIYRYLAQQVPGVLDVAVKSALLATVVKVKQQYDGHARHALLAAMGAHLDYNKMVIAVDEDVDIHDYEDIFWAYLTRGRADTRAWIINDVPGFYRDPLKDHWGRLLIDATKPRGREEEFERKRIPGEMEVRLEDYLGKGA